ncbi:hypothetical protein SEA_GIANTSBANE_25 [Arthrobacter phage Giantsbane]|nr:hypothetical protein SEA_GIANTSBANE_25 [Arthrobacter phage Giantsbane]
MAAQRYVVLTGSKVTNVVLWDAEDISAQGFETPNLILAGNEVSIGWELVDDTWVPPVDTDTEPTSE